MKSSAAAVLVLLLGVFATAKAQTPVNCQFTMSGGLYTCVILGITLPDNENLFIVIGGNHVPGLTNANVERVQIQFSTIPFIISQLFLTFPNLQDFQMTASGLTRIQTNAFANAARLRTVSIINHPQFTTIHANAFSGAADVRDMQIRNNLIGEVHELAFSGATTLESLNMDQNNIAALHHNTFRTLTQLRLLSMTDNILETIDGRLLGENRLLGQIDFSRNRINAIQRNFLDNFQNLLLLNVVSNICVNNFWIIQGGAGLDQVRTGLASCFNNFVETPDAEYRTFLLELIGSMIIRYENGTEIVHL